MRERFEDPSLLLLRNSDAGIAYRKSQNNIVGINRNAANQEMTSPRFVNETALPIKFQQYLAYPAAIANDLVRNIECHIDDELQILLARTELERLGAGGNYLAKTERYGIEFKLSSLDL